MNEHYMKHGAAALLGNDRFAERIGGKLGPSSGDPLDVEVTVVGLCDDLEAAIGGVPISLGAAAGIKVHLGSAVNDAPERGIDVTLNTRRGQGYSPSIFSTISSTVVTSTRLPAKTS